MVWPDFDSGRSDEHTAAVEVIAHSWPYPFDVVVLGGKGLFEGVSRGRGYRRPVAEGQQLGRRPRQLVGKQSKRVSPLMIPSALYVTHVRSTAGVTDEGGDIVGRLVADAHLDHYLGVGCGSVVHSVGEFVQQ